MKRMIKFTNVRLLIFTMAIIFSNSAYSQVLGMYSAQQYISGDRVDVELPILLSKGGVVFFGVDGTNRNTILVFEPADIILVSSIFKKSIGMGY